MARAETPTKLPLDRWAYLMGIDSRHFNGVYSIVHPPRVCEQPWFHYSWQSADRIGREELAQAISQAESDIEQELGYRLLPSWETDEWHSAEKPWRPDLLSLNGLDARGFSQVVKTDWGHFISGGIRLQTLLEADSAIVYTDEDSDDYDEIATVTTAVATGTSPCDIKVYFPLSNIMIQTGGEDQWEIRPVQISVVGAVATIRFRREQAVLPQLQLDLLPAAGDDHFRGVDGSVDSNFLEEVDVYQISNDPQTQISFLWEPFGQGCGCLSGTCELCAYAAQTGCLMVRGDPRLGLVSYRPGSWDAANSEFTSEDWAELRAPDIVRLYYRAGFRDKSLSCSSVTMSRDWERIVAYYSSALLDRPVC